MARNEALNFLSLLNDQRSAFLPKLDSLAITAGEIIICLLANIVFASSTTTSAIIASFRKTREPVAANRVKVPIVMIFSSLRNKVIYSTAQAAALSPH
jgi:hypothetical protein